MATELDNHAVAKAYARWAPIYDLVFGAVIVTALLTLTLFALVAALERVALRWRPPAQTHSRW